MLRYIGVICVFIFTFYIVFCYERYQKTQLVMGDAFLLLLKFLADEMEGCGRTPSECVREFCCAELRKTPFLSSVEEGRSLYDAYASARAHLCLPKEMDAILEGAFFSFGRGGRREESRRLSAQIARAEELLCAQREALARRLRLFRTLALASAMGLVILLM